MANGYGVAVKKPVEGVEMGIICTRGRRRDGTPAATYIVLAVTGSRASFDEDVFPARHGRSYNIIII